MKNMISMVAPRSHFLVLPVLLGLVTTSSWAVPTDGETRLLHGLEEVEIDRAVLCPTTAGKEDFRRTVADLAD